MEKLCKQYWFFEEINKIDKSLTGEKKGKKKQIPSIKERLNPQILQISKGQYGNILINFVPTNLTT